MKEVEWWIAKVYPKDWGFPRIDLWEKFKSRARAQAYVRRDGPATPFTVVKVTIETTAPRPR